MEKNDGFYKKICTICVALVLMFGLGGCGTKGEKEKQDYIEPAKLTEEEKDILTLCGTKRNQHIFDFAVDGKTEVMQIRVSELQDGQWQTIGKDSHDEIDEKGRFAIAGDDFGKSYSIGFTNGCTTWKADEEKEKFPPLGVTTAVLTERTEIVYGKEIPVLIQITSSKSEVSIYNVEESFAHPERYKDAGHEHIYAISVIFC